MLKYSENQKHKTKEENMIDHFYSIVTDRFKWVLCKKEDEGVYLVRLKDKACSRCGIQENAFIAVEY